jgi:hypothetical protein
MLFKGTKQTKNGLICEVGGGGDGVDNGDGGGDNDDDDIHDGGDDCLNAERYPITLLLPLALSPSLVAQGIPERQNLFS